MLTRHSALLVVVAIVTAGGCQRETNEDALTGQVQGTVTLDGSPVEGVRLVFIPFAVKSKSGKYQEIAYGTTDAQGKYALTRANGAKGAFLGPHRVLISKKKGAGNSLGEELNEELSVSDDSDWLLSNRLPFESEDEFIPLIYNLNSSLQFEVKSTLKINRADFELTTVDPLLVD